MWLFSLLLFTNLLTQISKLIQDFGLIKFEQKIKDQLETLQHRIANVMESAADAISKKVEIRKIINKSIRMRKFYAY